MMISTFYSAFQKKDFQTMQSCYHDNATFTDPVFGSLDAKQVKAMWHMLALSAGNIVITFSDVRVNGDEGSCHWEANYVFSGSGNKVHNVIDARFRFLEGKIIEHVDRFSLWRWAGMAFGWKGKMLGWTGLMRNKIRETAKKLLLRFIADHPEYA